MASEQTIVTVPNDSDPYAWLGWSLGLGLLSLISAGFGWHLIQDAYQTTSFFGVDIGQTDEKQLLFGACLLLLASVFWVLMLVVLGTVLAHKTARSLG